MRCSRLVSIVALGAVLSIPGRSAYASSTSTYQVAMNTAPLVGHASGPFSILFGFTDGSGFGDANNTVTVTNIDFGGGAGFGSPGLVGGATGSLESTVTITDSAFLNVFSEGFSPGTVLRFSVSITTAGELGGVPDRLTFFILDRSGTPIPTLASSADFLFGVDLTSAGGAAESFGSDPTRSPSAGAPVLIGAPVTQFDSRLTKAASRDALIGLLPSGSREANAELEDAIRHVDASLTPRFWADAEHLTSSGERVFEEEERAVRELIEIRLATDSLVSQVHSVAILLTRVDRELARTALVEAQQAGADMERLGWAAMHLARGDKLVGEDALAKAIESYEGAWLDVQRAMHLRADDDDHGEHHQQEDRR